jgi:RNA polymerase sigma-70 factor (ECF subfamily)
MAHSEFDQPAFLTKLRSGDQAAYRALIRRFHASLTRVAASVIGSHAQAEEVVQDAWLAVFANIARFEGRSSLTTWVFSIVMNRARTRIGREGRTVGLPSILDGAQPGERAVPAGQKAVIVLRDMEARTAEEACEILGISPENQRVLLHRARGRLRATIDRLTSPTAEIPAARPSPARRPGATGLARLIAWLLPHPLGAAC